MRGLFRPRISENWGRVGNAAIPDGLQGLDRLAGCLVPGARLRSPRLCQGSPTTEVQSHCS